MAQITSELIYPSRPAATLVAIVGVGPGSRNAVWVGSRTGGRVWTACDPADTSPGLGRLLGPRASMSCPCLLTDSVGLPSPLDHVHPGLPSADDLSSQRQIATVS